MSVTEEDVFVGIEYLESYSEEWPRVGYANTGDAGFDLRAAIDDPVVIEAGQSRLIPSGIKMQIPDLCDEDAPGVIELQIRPRSGLALKHGISVLNSPGTIDSGYRGEIGVILINHGWEDFVVTPGDRIAQAVFALALRPPIATIRTVNATDRGTKGFGSSGVAA